VSWGSWADNAYRGITIPLVLPLYIFVAGPHPASVATRENSMDSFGSRLRYERERRQIALKSIAESTKISVSLLEGLERDDVSRWPSGIFRRSFVRSYAEALGLKPEAIVREFVERYPDPLEVDVAAPSAVARSLPPSSPSSGPLAIKLTITWSGSVHHTIGRWADSPVGRLVYWVKSLNVTIAQSAHMPMVASSPRGSGGADRDRVPPA
jgi:transcriptional regulator with XRE-family HTH domain